MKKNILALGIFLLFLGIVLIGVSGMDVSKPEKKWTVVSEVKEEEATPLTKLAVQGNLEQGDTFRAYFELSPRPQTGAYSIDVAVVVNLTDPNGNTRTYDIPITYVGIMPANLEPFPEGVANYTGTYKLDAWGIWGAALNYLALKKMEFEEVEPQYPYSNLSFVGGATFLGGIGTLFLGIKAPRRKRRFIERRLTRRKH